MQRISTEITITGTAEQVWSALTDFAQYPRWNPLITEVSGEASPGARLAVRVRLPWGIAMTFRPTVQEASRARELRWVGHLLLPGLFDGEHRFRIEATGEHEVRFEQSEEFRGLLVPIIPRSMYERTRRGFDAMNRALKERVEKT